MNSVFVFGSNLAGRHGAGAALHALNNCGAIYGQGVGRQGNSYAIPTKSETLKSLSKDIIKDYVDQFIQYAKENSREFFLVTAIGTGLAGYSHSDIAPMFKDAPPNCILPPEWEKYNVRR